MFVYNFIYFLEANAHQQFLLVYTINTNNSTKVTLCKHTPAMAKATRTQAKEPKARTEAARPRTAL
jgi:hypothetical protein